MPILTISGSSRADSINKRLLENLPHLINNRSFYFFEGIKDLPLFNADNDDGTIPVSVVEWRKAVKDSEAIIICTPEYIFNLPSVLKNALEWVTSSGEFQHKAVLPITFTPHPPRGEKSMQSLLWSLQALDTRIVASLSLYQSDIEIDDEGNWIKGNDEKELLIAAVRLL